MLNEETYLITGSSRGLGFEIAKRLLNSTSSVVVGLARSAAPDELLARKNYHHIQTDLSNPSEVREVFSKLQSKNLLPYRVILNAALRQDHDWEKVFYVNCIAQIYLLKQAISQEKIQEIIVVNSVFAWFPDRSNFAYASSKRALASAVDALNYSSGRKDIKIKQVFLGPLADGDEEVSMIFEDKGLIAEKLINKLNRSKSIKFLSLKDWALHLFLKWSPAGLSNAIINRFQR